MNSMVRLWKFLDESHRKFQLCRMQFLFFLSFCCKFSFYFFFTIIITILWLAIYHSNLQFRFSCVLWERGIFYLCWDLAVIYAWIFNSQCFVCTTDYSCHSFFFFSILRFDERINYVRTPTVEPWLSCLIQWNIVRIILLIFFSFVQPSVCSFVRPSVLPLITFPSFR